MSAPPDEDLDFVRGKHFCRPPFEGKRQKILFFRIFVFYYSVLTVNFTGIFLRGQSNSTFSWGKIYQLLNAMAQVTDI